MKRNSLPYINDQRGVAMLLELVLVAAVLALVGLAVYQTSHHSAPTATTTTNTAPASKQAVANSAATAAEAAANTESDLSASAETAADNEVNAASQDATNLGGSSNAAF